jgi:hypothetical protein
MAVLAEVVVVVVVLEYSVVFDDPVHPVRDIRSQHRRGDLAVVGRCQNVSDVVEERGANHLFVFPGTMRPGCCL